MSSTHLWANSPFLTSLILACSCNYRPEHPLPVYTPEPGEKPIAQLKDTLLSLVRLRYDLFAEIQNLRRAQPGGVDFSVSQVVQEFFSDFPATLSPGEIGKHFKGTSAKIEETAARQQQIDRLERWLRLTNSVVAGFAAATLPEFEGRTYRSMAVDENGFTYVTGEGAKPLLPQGHPLVQAGKAIVLILAGEDRPDVLGIPAEATPFNGDMRTIGGTATLESLRLGSFEALAVIDESPHGTRLRRLAALVQTLAETPVTDPVSIASLGESLERLQVAKGYLETVYDAFWEIARAAYEIPPETRNLALRAEDWAITSLSDGAVSAVEQVLRGVFPAGLSFGFGERRKVGCGNPECANCGGL